MKTSTSSLFACLMFPLLFSLACQKDNPELETTLVTETPNLPSDGLTLIVDPDCSKLKDTVLAVSFDEKSGMKYFYYGDFDANGKPC